YVTSMWSTSAPNTTATYAPRRTSSSQPNSTARLNMKQNTAYGASLMTSPIRVIETSNRPSMPRRSVSIAGVALLTTMPTPNISAKNISARIEALLDAAPTTLSGTIDSSISTPLTWSPLSLMMACARSALSLSSSCASTGSTPVPGLNTSTITRPSTTAMPDSRMV